MKKIILLLSAVAVLSCSDSKQPQRDADGAILKNGQFYDSQEEETNEVWICMGKSSHAYHSSQDCYGIQACRGQKKKVTKEEALSMGRTPCHYCHNESDEYSRNSKQNQSDNSYDVYVCTSSSATKYHRKNCSALSRCGGEIEVMDPEYAEDLGYSPCGLCCR